MQSADEQLLKQDKQYFSILITKKRISEEYQQVLAVVSNDQLQKLNLNEKPTTTEIIVDNRTGQLKLAQKYKNHNTYLDKKYLYEKLAKDLIEQAQQVSQFQLLPCEYDDRQRVIFFIPGACTLQQLLDQHNFNVTPDQAVQIFTILLESIITLKEKGYYHLNLKPENIQLVSSQENDNYYNLKLVDFEVLPQLQYSATFFNNPVDDFNLNKICVQDDVENKLKQQFYSVIRVLQFILYGARNQDSFLLSNDLDKDNKLAQLKQVQKQINQQYTDPTNIHQINKILEFITQQGLEEKYTFGELKILLINLKKNIQAQQTYFHDSQNLVKEIAQIQHSEMTIKQFRDPLALFIQLKTFIPQMGSYSVLGNDQFDIVSQLKKIITQEDKSSKNIVIVGKSGAGKTLLLTKLMQDLKAHQLDYDLVQVNLGELSFKDKQQKQVKIDICNIISAQLQALVVRKQQLLVLLDGYDKIDFKMLKISNLINKKFKSVKIIVTARYDNATEVEFLCAFGQHDKIYISPFGKEQQRSYIDKLLEYSQTNNDFSFDYKILHSSTDYLQILNKNYSLDRQCSLPQTLSLVVLSMHELKKQFQNDQKHAFSKYEIYESFIEHYNNTKIKNVVKNEKYKNVCINKYVQQDYYEKLKKDIKNFNHSCSWNMAQTHKHELSDNDLQNIVNKVLEEEPIYSDLIDLIITVSPSAAINTIPFSYVHSQFQEFYIAQSIIEETLNAQGNAINENKTLIGTAYLRFNMDILSLVAEHVMEMSLELQHSLFYETWYRSVLLTRKIRKDNINDELTKTKLEIIGSNFVNFLAGPAGCDLQNRDFSDCAIPYAYFYKRNLSGCNFNNANMDNCLISEAKLDNTTFIGTSLKNLKNDVLTYFTGHSQGVRSVAFSPDGKYLASGSADKTVKLWSFETQKEIATLRGHIFTVRSVAFSRDCKYLASGSNDNSVRLWSIQNYNIIATLKGHADNVSSVAFSPNTKYLASGSEDQTIGLWSVESQQKVSQLQGHTQKITSVVFSPDGMYLASGSYDETIKLWSIQSKQVVYTLTGHSFCVFSIAFSPDSKYLASGSEDQTIKLWSLESQTEVATLQGHNKYVTAVAFSPDGKYLASGSYDNKVKLWSVESYREIASLHGHSDYVLSIAFSPDGNFLVSGSWDRIVKLQSIKSQTEINQSQGHSWYVNCVAFSPDGKQLASGSQDSTVKLWSIESQKLLTTLQGHSKYVNSVAFSPDGKYLASASCDNTVKLWSLQSDNEVVTLQGYRNFVNSVAFSPDGKYLVSGSYDSTIKLWEVESKKEIATLQKHHYTVSSVTLSPDGKYLASGSYDNTVMLWDLESKKVVTTLKGHTKYVTSVAFSPNGKYFASGSYDNMVKLWSVKSKKEVANLLGHSTIVTSVAFSPDGKYLASGSWDNTVKLWDVESQKEVNKFQGHSQYVTSVAFSPDGKYLASGSWDNTVNLWRVDQQSELNSLQEKSNQMNSVLSLQDGKELNSANDDNNSKLFGKLIQQNEQKLLHQQSKASNQLLFPQNKGKIEE